MYSLLLTWPSYGCGRHLCEPSTAWDVLKHGHADADREIARKKSSGLHQLSLLSGKPVLNLRREDGHPCDVVQHSQVLEISAVEPSKMVLTQKGDAQCHELDPLWLVQPSEQPTLLRRPDLRKLVVTAGGVADRTRGVGPTGQLGAGKAVARMEPPSMTRHLGRTTERPDTGLDSGMDLSNAVTVERRIEVAS
jgi:hypothetical protein